MKNDLPVHINGMLSPTMYPHPVQMVELVQTHSSFVFLAGDFVYKIKKDVDFGFLDFSSLEKRRYFCHQELILNRRLCPEIYLDVVTINQLGKHYSLNGPGEIVEYGVMMKRLPENRMMNKVIKNDQMTLQHLDQLVETLVPFYQQPEKGEHIDHYGTAEAVGRNVIENFEQTESYVGKGALSKKQFALITAYSRDMLDRDTLFTSRIKNGFICDCHGDLHSANICLAEKVYIYDCIEFNSRLRYGDVAADIAFLAMDLDFYGLVDFSEYFVSSYSSAANDPGLIDLLSFYKCYRAFVRGKVGLFTAADETVEKSVRQECLEGGRHYFQLAERYATL